MKLKLSYLLAAAVFSTAAISMAQDKPERPAGERPSREEFRERFRNVTPEEREARIKEFRERQSQNGQSRPQGDRVRGAEEGLKQLGLTPEEFRNLSPEERRAKMKEASDKKVAELKAKEAGQTITEEEKKLLQRLEARQRYLEQNRDGGPRRDGPPGERPTKPEGEKPPGKPEGKPPGKPDEKPEGKVPENK